uniref:DEAD (Asp-Glu-Ala-Asp) box polypeptide 27 n=1 Tax=Lates calcarifer TaxID=8187 RepID=A0A4W6DFW0_LATCA
GSRLEGLWFDHEAVTALGFKQPTPIQKACVPVGLLGRDLCACAATGTGKTAAFMLPVLERLVYKPRMSQVKDLAAVSLKQPIRIFVNSNTDVAPFLRQEFVRIRPNREGDREAVVAGTS